MVRTPSHSRSVFAGFQFLFSAPMILWSLTMGFALLLLPMTFARSQPTALETASMLLRDSNPAVREQGMAQLAQIGSAEAITYLADFFLRERYLRESGAATAHALATIGSSQSYQVLIDALRQVQPSARRSAAMRALAEARPSVEPMLKAASNDPDTNVREAAAQILDFRRGAAPMDASLAPTHDVHSNP